MGQQCECACVWNGRWHEVKASLEPPELILRGQFRKRLSFAELADLRVNREQLAFTFRGEPVSLLVGGAQAARWLKAMQSPPPSLAKKLGISSGSIVKTIGTMDAPELNEALAEAQAIDARSPTLIVARVNQPAELAAALQSAAGQLAAGVPIWLVYPKGKGHPLNETDVRSAALSTGIVDTKVAAVSKSLTGLRFVKRKVK